MKILVDGIAQANIKKFIQNPNFPGSRNNINRVDPPAGREIEALADMCRHFLQNTLD